MMHHANQKPSEILLFFLQNLTPTHANFAKPTLSQPLLTLKRPLPPHPDSIPRRHIPPTLPPYIIDINLRPRTQLPLPVPRLMKARVQPFCRGGFIRHPPSLPSITIAMPDFYNRDRGCKIPLLVLHVITPCFRIKRIVTTCNFDT